LGLACEALAGHRALSPSLEEWAVIGERLRPSLAALRTRDGDSVVVVLVIDINPDKDPSAVPVAVPVPVPVV